MKDGSCAHLPHFVRNGGNFMGHVDALQIMAYANEIAKRTLIVDIKSADDDN